ncbi:MAG: Gfo/Idh/MocA family oxidoreductase [Desulfobacterales bacterium]|nr:Gfo/Idh/MocA family oxidoreductase [Desulfobacterales bacterium]
MHILFIGHSRIVQKRVLPALSEISFITDIDIASHTSASKISLPNRFKGEIFNDYNTALSKSKADLVYISIVNSAHAEWAEKALKKGFHVIVDKPSFTCIDDAKRLVDLSQKHNLCLAEATVFAYHPQIQVAKNAFLNANSIPIRLTATFSFPPLNPNDFRYKRELGGGALWDLGPYAVANGRLFFNEEPKEIFCRVCSKSGDDNIDTSFSMLATYSDGRSMVGHFGFNTEYRNNLNILAPSVSIDIDRIFTTSPEMENEVHIRQHNEKTTVRLPKADSFSLFLQKVIEGIQTGDYRKFVEDLLSDASVLHRLRLVAFEG